MRQLVLDWERESSAVPAGSPADQPAIPLPTDCLSDDLRYRYYLRWPWAPGPMRPSSTVGFIMLNPSVATKARLDKTMRRVIGFGKSWGYGAAIVTNLYALVSTDPERLRTVANPVGPDNNRWLRACLPLADRWILGWGQNACPERARAVLTMLGEMNQTLWVLRLNGDGSPGHPLYLPKVLRPVACTFDGRALCVRP